MRVRNTEGASGAAPRPFAVTINPERFDVNQSDPTTAGRLDGRDTVWIARLFGTREEDVHYDPAFDFDGDGWIDGEELSWLGSNLGRCWDGTAWTRDACPDSPGLAP